MSYGFSTYVACPQIQEALDNKFLHDPTEIQDAIGLPRFLVSEANTNGTLQRLINPGGGKYRQVELTYQPRFSDASSDSAIQSCGGGQEYGDTSQIYEIDTTVGFSRPWTITQTELAARCQSDSAWVANQIQKHMDAAARHIADDAAAFAVANTGYYFDQNGTKYNSTTDPYDTQTMNSAGAYVPNMTMDITMGFEMTEWPMPYPYIFGDGLPYAYIKATNAGCCALQGVDIRELAMQNPYVFLRDTYVAQNLDGYNQFLVLGAGAIQMLQYRQFEGPDNIIELDLPDKKQGVLVDPKTGIAYDFYAAEDCGVWNFQLKLAYKFVVLPTDVFNDNDRLDGTNGILKYEITNP